MGRKSLKSIVDSVAYVMEYQKYMNPHGIYYAFHKPQHIKMIDLEITEDLLPSTIKMRLETSYLHPADHCTAFTGIFDINQIDAMHETDPLCYVTVYREQIVKITDEKLKKAIREKFDIEELKPSEKFGSKTNILGKSLITNTVPALNQSEPIKENDYQVIDRATGKILGTRDTIEGISGENPQNIEKLQEEKVQEKLQVTPKKSGKKKESLESFIKHTKKVTRYCADCRCGAEIQLYRSDLIRGRGFYCSKSCSNPHKLDEKIINVCRNCQTEYTSINFEEFCCVECEKFFNQQQMP